MTAGRQKMWLHVVAVVPGSGAPAKVEMGMKIPGKMSSPAVCPIWKQKPRRLAADGGSNRDSDYAERS